MMCGRLLTSWPERVSGTRVLPRQRLAVAEESAGGTVGGEGCRPDDSSGTFCPRATATATHVSGDPTWADCVDKDVSTAKLTCESARQGIQGSLGDLIGGRPSAHLRERS